ncbi:cysteine/serine endopeptidase inhibitor [Streptomyces sp. MMS24-I2-30]|uniref:cysteine/serine endopeptidase inhibitor n=1 Tax=Streptomyces sp. MMS24-I2-30 TaxID=3351564 RepID=UPI0038969FAF
MQHGPKRTVITVTSVGVLLGAVALAQADFGRVQDLSAVPVGDPRTGTMTWYDNAGKGACGTDINAAIEEFVALPNELWTAANPNNDSLCKGVSVEVTYNGKTLTLPVKDKCPTCSAEHIDLSKPAFQKLADLDVGVVTGITWKIVDTNGGNNGGGNNGGGNNGGGNNGGGDTQAPSAPANLRSPGQTPTSVSLAWDASSDNVGVTGYEVYADGSEIPVGTNTGATIADLAENAPHTFTVVALDAAGNVSGASNAVSVALAATGGGSGGESGSCPSAWSATQSYVPGDVVTFRGHKYTASFYASGAVPGAPTSWAVWQDDGVCGG